MLHYDIISIGKIRQAFNLKASEADEIIKTLRSSVAPYVIWHKAYELYWEKLVLCTAQKHNISAPVFPQTRHQDFTVLEIGSNVFSFFSKILPLAEKTAIQDGIQYVFEQSYDIIPDRAFWWIEQFQDSVPFIAQLDDESYVEQVAINNRTFSAKTHHGFLEAVFQDTFAINKRAAVQSLVSCGYPFVQEVKGLSRAFFESCVQQYFTPPTAPVEAVPQEDSNALNPDGAASALRVPRHLWEGKSPTTARDAMRREGFDDAVVAHVLFVWCGINNKTRVGKFLAKTEMEDSGYRKLCQRLLNKAENINIITS